MSVRNSSVCMYTHISQKPRVQISPKFRYMLLVVAVARSSSDGNVIRAIYAFPVLWMTSCFNIMWSISHSQAWRYVLSRLPGGGAGSEVCRFRLHLFYSEVTFGFFAPQGQPHYADECGIWNGKVGSLLFHAKLFLLDWNIRVTLASGGWK